MSKFSPLAFIDNGQIKVTDEDGEEYTTCIEKRLERLQNVNRRFKFSFSAIFLFLFLLFSQTVVSFFSPVQMAIFTAATVISVLVTLAFAHGKSDANSSYEIAVSEFNRAKHVLQPRIMQLEEQLTQHQAKLQYLEKSQKFNFKEMDM